MKRIESGLLKHIDVNANDPHLQYLKVDGLRPMMGNLDMDGYNINNATIDGYSIANIFDHGNLNGLGDDDHTQYLLTNGTRAMANNLNMNGYNITNVGTVDGYNLETFITGILVNGTKVTEIVTKDPAASHATANVSTISDGIPPEQAIEVSDLIYSSWWTGLTGLTTVKYVDARYSGQTTDGAIAAWDDLSGNQDLIQVIPAQNPELVTSGFIGDNGQYVKFLPASPSTPKLLSGNDVTAGLTIPCTLMIVARHYNTDSTIKTIAELSNGGLLRWSLSNSSSTVVIQNGQGGTVVTRTNADARLSSTRVNLHAVVVNGVNSYLWDNGIKQTVDLTISGTWAPTIAQMGAQGTTLNGFQGEMRTGIMFIGAATQAQLEYIFSNICGQVPTNLVHVGDSLTSTSLISQTSDILSDYTWCDSDAVAGSNLGEMFTRFNANVTPKYKSSMRNVLALWGGTEDIADGYTGNQTAGLYWKYCDLARRNGWKVIAITMLPRGTFTELQNEYIIDFNNELTQHWRNHCDSVISVHKILGLSSYNTTCWNPDQINLNDEGNSRVARAISVTIRKLCQS